MFAGVGLWLSCDMWQKALIGINSLYLWKNISRLSDLQGGQSGGRAVTSICHLDCMSFPHDSLSNTKSESFLGVLVAPKLITSFAPVQVRLEGGLAFSLSKKDKYWHTPFRSL